MLRVDLTIPRKTLRNLLNYDTQLFNKHIHFDLTLLKTLFKKFINTYYLFQ